MTNKISIVIPAKNEAKSLEKLLPKLKSEQPGVEIIVVNDGSMDGTSYVCKNNNVHEVRQPYSKGNGAAIKAGARIATGDVIVFMDGDGQHRPEDVSRLVAKINEGYDMVVGARSGSGQASIQRSIGNLLYNYLSSWMVGHKIHDLTSGFRAVRREKFMEYLYLLPNKFSYPTTITMAFFRAGYSVSYLPIDVDKRSGKSHLKPITDGVRFLIIIFKVGTLYSPLKMFTPVASLFFLSGVLYYLYTYLSFGRFTNMSALLFTASIVIFMMGLLSEQVSALLYNKKEN